MDACSLPNRVCLGDLVGYGTWPNEVVALIWAAQIPTIMGNYDQGVGQDSDDCGCAYKDPISEALGKRSIAWLNEHTRQAIARRVRWTDALTELHRWCATHRYIRSQMRSRFHG